MTYHIRELTLCTQLSNGGGREGVEEISAPEVVPGPDGLLTDPGRDEAGRGDVEGRVPDLNTRQAGEQLPSWPLFYGNVPATGATSVQGRHRHSDIERDPGRINILNVSESETASVLLVIVSQDSKTVGPNLVSRVSIVGHSVTARHHC